MKKLNVMLSSITMLLMMSMICSCHIRPTSPAEPMEEPAEEPKEELQEEPKEEPRVEIVAPVVGELHAYFAKEDFKAGDGDYQKGQLICDSNDPINRIVDKDAQNYKYEGDEGDWEYTWLLPKSKVEKRTYTMNQLSVENVGKKAVFVAEDGCEAHIFWSNINGHKCYNMDGSEEDLLGTERLSACYVISVDYIMDGEKYVLEEPLGVKEDNIELYVENRYAGSNAKPSDCRYREGLIGLVEDMWNNAEGWEYGKTAYDKDGNLLTDQWYGGYIPECLSIAYVAELDALYINGVLYYRK